MTYTRVACRKLEAKKKRLIQMEEQLHKLEVQATDKVYTYIYMYMSRPTCICSLQLSELCFLSCTVVPPLKVREFFCRPIYLAFIRGRRLFSDVHAVFRAYSCSI